MGFFDLNIPFNEDTKPSPDNQSKKNERLKTVVKAMELGYTGVAYNRSMKGVMSDADRCGIPLFPLASLLKAAPSLSNNVKFHRDLLAVPLNSPFRQYTRLTVIVDSPLHGNALNAGNPVLKTYDVVAVRPLNQMAFENACKIYEVDVISIDFSERLPFRMKYPVVKAAMERGVYFEISYSRLLSDVQNRRQMVTNAKLLVDWTRGKNIILSSAAGSVNELRGPYDVANLSSLLGLSMERAKAAVSKNCRALLASSLKKKFFYKETIKVERAFSTKPSDPKEPWVVEGNKWDSISSGDGDLMLDDIAKFFSAYNEVTKAPKAIDFASIVEEMPSQGMNLKDWLVDGRGKVQSSDDTSSTLSIPKEFRGSSENTNQENSNQLLKHSEVGVKAVTCEVGMIIPGTSLNQQISVCQDVESAPQVDTSPAVFTDANELEVPAIYSEDPKSSDGGVPVAVEINLHDTLAACEENPILPDVVVFSTPVKDIEISPCNGNQKESASLHPVSTIKGGSEHTILSKEADKYSSCNENFISDAQDVRMKEVYNETEDLRMKEVYSKTEDVRMKEVCSETEEREQTRLVSVRPEISVNMDFAKGEQPSGDADENMLDNSFTEMQEATLVVDEEPLQEASVEKKNHHEEIDAKVNCMLLDESKSGKVKIRQTTSLGALHYPFKSKLMSLYFYRSKLRNRRTR